MPQLTSLVGIKSLTKPSNQFRIKDPSTGNEFNLEWNKLTPPTDDDIDEILGKHNLNQTADEQNIADAQKPFTGWEKGLSDTITAPLIAGTRAINYLGKVGKGMVESTPAMEFARGTQELSKSPEEQRKNVEETGKAIGQGVDTLTNLKHPYRAATAAANMLDPTGIVPSYMGLGESAVGHIKNREFPEAGVDIGLGALPLLFAGNESPIKSYSQGYDNPSLIRPKQLYPQTVDSGAPAAPRALLGPPREPITPISTQRFPVEPGGRAIDLQDPNTVNIFDTQKQTGLSAFGKGDTVYPSPPKLPRVEPPTLDPTKYNALPPIDQLPTTVRGTTIIPDVAPVTEQGLTTTGPIETGLPQSKIVRGFRPPQDVTAWPGAEPPKVVGAGSTIPRTGLWNRLLGDSGEYEIGKATTELQKMKEEFLKRQEEKRNLPPVDLPQKMSVPPPEREPVTPPDELTHPTAINIAKAVIKLDNQNLPDDAYKGLFSGKKALTPGETWRSRAIDYIDHFEGIAMEDPSKYGNVRLGKAGELPKVEPITTEPITTQPGELPAVEPIETPKVIGRGRKPLFAGGERVPRKEWPSLTEVDKPQEMQIPKGMSESDAIDSENIRTNRIRDLSVVPMKGDFTPAFKRNPAAADLVKSGVKHIAGFDRNSVTVELNDGRTLIVNRGDVTGIHPEAGRSFEAGKVEHYPVLHPEKFDTEGNLKQELPPVDKPQEMKVREGGYSGTEDRPVGPVIINPDTGRPNLAMGGADPQVLRQLGTSLYTKDRPSILIQELMQNTIDEMKIANVQKPIRVAFTEETKHPINGQKAKSIIFQDFGRGMNEGQLYNEFSDVGKSGKRNIQGAAGGFGFAKAAPFLGGDHMRVESVTNEGGKVVKYTFEGAPEEFLNQEVGVPLHSEVVPDTTPTGMRVEVFFPHNKSFYNAKDLLQTITESSPDVKDVETFTRHRVPDTADPTSDIYKFTREGETALSPYGQTDVKKFQGKPLPSYKDTISTPENDANVYYDLDNKERTGTKLIFLNNGIFYHAENQGASIHAMPHIPERIVIDIKSKVAEGHDKYPFPANRQGLNEEVKSGYRSWVDDNVIAPARAVQTNELKTLYDNTVPKPGMGHVVLDSGEKYTPEELTRVEKSVTLNKVARIMGTLLEDLESHFDKEELVGYTNKHGFRIADPGSGGMNISDPATNSPNLRTLVTVNPFDGLHTGFTSRTSYNYAPKTLQPPEAARRIVHLIKHEFTHNLARSEGAGFTWAFSQVDTRFPNTTHYESQIFKALTDKAGNYDPEVSGLLQEYLDSRGRPGIKEDILARQAASIADDSGRKPEGISGSNKPDGEGITGPVEPVKPAGAGVKKPSSKVIRALREEVASKEQIENELATGDLPQVEPVKNWGGTPETISIEGKGGRLAGKKNKFEYPSEADILDLPSAPIKKPLSERLGIEPTEEAKPAFKSGKGYIDPNKVDVVYPGREFIKGKGNVNKIMEERAAEKAAESTPSFQDPGGFKANYASPHKTLSNSPLTEPIARNIVQAYDKKIQWIRAKLESAAPFISKLGKSDRGLLGKALDTGDFSNLTPELTAKAKGLKNILDQIHTEFPENKNVGYIKNYFTHIADEPKEGMARSIINLFKDNEVKTGPGAGNIGDFYEQGLGTPDSPYIKRRTGALKNINYDVKSVLPQYLDSIAKVIFDQPAVEKAKTYLKHVPEGSKLKDLASWYIKNYTMYDSEAALHRAFTSPVSKIANTTARAFIDFNPGLHALHLGELPVNIWPELGSKYTAHGIKEVTLNPLRTWTETSKLGLIQGETKPFAFKTAGERWQSVAYFLNTTEKFVKGVGYEGAKQMYLDKGFSPAEASRKAVELTKDMTLDTGPARQLKGLSNESNTAGGEVSSRLGGQFKGIPIKIAEQMYNVAKNAKANPKAALRMLAGSAAMIYATKKGAHLFHLDPASLARTTALGAFGTAAADFTSALYRGDYETAVEDAASWVIPGGQSAKKIYESVTDKESRTKALAAQRQKEGKSFGGPPVNTLKRAVDYMFKGS